VDIAPNMLQQAQNKLIKNKLEANLQIMDVQKLNFPDNSFDAVFSMAAFEFITDIKKAYQQMRRVVKPGGSIIIGTIQKYSSWADLYESPACYGTAYEYAKFKTAQQIIDLDSKRFVKRQDCLFIPPNQPENYYTLINEQKNESKSMKGGFT
ncbi:class I SAM-dependent methyltransferase, partial [Lactobacillus sp. XV13L]|nr:class I SAM-dependent methyltransferase [Lactobacillus sp. XV13L]